MFPRFEVLLILLLFKTCLHKKVKGCFGLSDVFSAKECELILSLAETIGFIPDVPETGLSSTLADNCNILLPEEDF